MSGIENRRVVQEWVTPLIVAPLVGFGIAMLTPHFSTAMTVGLVCGLPFSVLMLCAIPVGWAKLRDLGSHLRWWHFLWFLTFLSGLVFRVRDAAVIETNLLDPWALYRIGLVGAVALVLLGRLATWGTRWGGALFRGLIAWLASYAVIGLASTVWSLYPMWTLYKSVEYLVDVCLVAAVVTSVRTAQEFKTLFDWTWVLVGVLAMTVWLGTLIWPELAVHRNVGLLGIQIEGVMPAVAANSVGELGALLGIVALNRLLFSQRHRGFYAVVSLFGISTLVLSQSRSPLTGFAAALILVLFASRRMGIAGLFVSAVPALFFLTDLGDLFWKFFLRGQSEKLFSSLTGRVEWWEAGWEFFKEQPFLGYGAYAGARFGVFAEIGNTMTSSIHNTWAEVALGSGLFGLLPLLGAFVGTWFVLLRFVPYIVKGTLLQLLHVEAIGVLAVLFVRSMFSSGGIIWHPSLAFLLVLGYAEFLRRNS